MYLGSYSNRMKILLLSRCYFNSLTRNQTFDIDRETQQEVTTVIQEGEELAEGHLRCCAHFDLIQRLCFNIRRGASSDW